MTLKGSGNVGIGTTSPGGRLEIVKDAVANNNATRLTSHLSLGIKSGTQTVHNVGTSIFMGSAAETHNNYGITLQTLRYQVSS